MKLKRPTDVLNPDERVDFCFFRDKQKLIGLVLLAMAYAFDLTCSRVNAAIEDVTSFNATVPFACSFSGGSDVVEMAYTKNDNGSSGLLLGTSEALSITSNQLPRLSVTLNTVLAPRNIGFRGVFIRSIQQNRQIQSKTTGSVSNAPISTTISASKFSQFGFATDSSYDINLTVSALLSNSFPFEEYQFDVLLTCLAP